LALTTKKYIGVITLSLTLTSIVLIYYLAMYIVGGMDLTLDTVIVYFQALFGTVFLFTLIILVRRLMRRIR